MVETCVDKVINHVKLLVQSDGEICCCHNINLILAHIIEIHENAIYV